MTRVRLAGESTPRTGRVGVIVAVVLLGAVLFFAWRGSRSDVDLGGMTLEERYQVDERLVPLLADCGFGAAFEADTTDLAQILVSKLDEGAQLDPQRRAKTDLAAMGAEVAEPLMRLFQRASKQQWHEGVARNVLTVCSLAEGDWGVPIALEALRSPRETLRADAAIVLERHPSPEYYDRLEAVLRGFGHDVNIERCLKAMNACDPARFAREVPGWIEKAGETDGYIQSPLLDTAAPLVAGTEDPEVAELLADAADAAEGLLIRHRLYLIAPKARLGDAEARQELTDTLAHELKKPRHHATSALYAAGLVDETYVLAATSLDPEERAETLAQILDPIHDPARSPERRQEVIDWARAALSDEDPGVREVALRGLLRRKDEEGRSALMMLLDGTIQDRGVALRAARESLDDWPEVADQARTVLVEEWEEELDASRRSSELTNVLQALGSIPGRATGEFLLDAGDLIGANTIGGLSAFRWCVGQAYNAGPEARAVIRERLEVETDPLKRLDLISFVWQDIEPESIDASVDALIAIVDDETLSPYERLYAADRAIRMGHSDRVLPVLKRVYRGSTDPVLRPG
ncbi:MAG: hypothetical protein AAGA20_05965, partial [Planctomycetota bacterium]